VVEGVVNHQLLTLHHVRDDIADSTLWDVGFLCFGAMLVIAGALLARSQSRRLVGGFGSPVLGGLSESLGVRSGSLLRGFDSVEQQGRGGGQPFHGPPQSRRSLKLNAGHLPCSWSYLTSVFRNQLEMLDIDAGSIAAGVPDLLPGWDLAVGRLPGQPVHAALPFANRQHHSHHPVAVKVSWSPPFVTA
jgi:hypothetical protein